MLVYRLYRTLVFVVLLLGVMDVLLVLYGWVAHGSLDMTSHVSVLLFFGALMLFLVVRMRWVGQIAQALNDNPPNSPATTQATGALSRWLLSECVPIGVLGFLAIASALQIYDVVVVQAKALVS